MELPSQTYPLGVCNDGTHAGYYHDTDTSKQGHKVHVNLQGGNLCDSAQDCQARCDQNHDGDVDNHLCTAPTKETISMDHGMFSSSASNPLHDYWHVHIPYCSSDTWAGTRNGSPDTAGFAFHGKHIFRNVMNHLSHHFNLFQATHFVLSGTSAGAFGVGLNCDDVADWLHGNNPGMDVRCIADAPDFIPWWVHSPDCPRRQPGYQDFVNEFWHRDPDHSCQAFANDPTNNITDPSSLCGILSQSYRFISTPLLILVSLQDTAISRDYGCPQDDELIMEWMVEQRGLVMQAVEEHPSIGWFVPSCPVHVITGAHWDSIAVHDVYTGEDLTARMVLDNWIKGEPGIHAVDQVTQVNPSCPQNN